MSKKRKIKNEEKSLETKEQEYVIQIGLNSILPDDHKNFENIINDTVIKCTRILFDSNKLLQLHILRCLNNNISLPEIDQTYLNTINRIITDCVGGKLFEDKKLLHTFNQFFPNYKKSKRDFIVSILNESNNIYITNCENHISLNFEKRVKLFFKTIIFQYCHVNNLQLLSNEDLYNLINKCWSCILFKEDTKTIFDLYTTDEKYKEIYLNLYDYTEDIIKYLNNINIEKPYENKLRAKWNELLPLFYHFLKYIENYQLLVNNDKKMDVTTKNKYLKSIRLFSLLPNKSSFVLEHISINKSTLWGLLKLYNPDWTVTWAKWKENVELRIKIFEQIFNISEQTICDFKNKTFKHLITTNGKYCSVHFRKKIPNLESNNKSNKKQKISFDNKQDK